MRVNARQSAIVDLPPSPFWIGQLGEHSRLLLHVRATDLQGMKIFSPQPWSLKSRVEISRGAAQPSKMCAITHCPRQEIDSICGIRRIGAINLVCGCSASCRCIRSYKDSALKRIKTGVIQFRMRLVRFQLEHASVPSKKDRNLTLYWKMKITWVRPVLCIRPTMQAVPCTCIAL